MEGGIKLKKALSSGKLKGTKQKEAKELKLLNGKNKADYRKGK